MADPRVSIETRNSHRIRHSLRTLSVAALFALGTGRTDVSADPCPESCVFGYCSTVARRDTTLSGPAPAGGYDTMYAGYDAPAGRVRAGGEAGSDGSFGATAIARDRFTLLGPASGAPIGFSARLRVIGSAYAYPPTAGIHGSLQYGNDPPLSAGVSTTWEDPVVSLDQTLSLRILQVVGASFELTYTASASGRYASSQASLVGLLSFADLPPGYYVVSCQGFASDPAVPARISSWGRVKVTYR